MDTMNARVSFLIGLTLYIFGSVAALHVVTALTGSALLALALLHGVLDSDSVWAAAHVDEDWNSEKWGTDQEVAARRAARLVDFRAAAGILGSLSGIG